MDGMNFRIVVILIIGVLCASLLSCGSKEDEPIYNPEADEDRFAGGTAGLYEIDGSAPPPDTTIEEEYESPWGPKFPKQIQWAPTIKDAVNRATPGSGKKVLVWFVSRDCEECDRAEKEVFPSEVVLKYAHKYIWVRIDADKDPDLTQYYIQDHRPPVLKWLDQDGNAYNTLYGGFDDPSLLAAHLRDKH